MAGLQRSSISFRRQGSSGFIWDDKFLSDELNKANKKEDSDTDTETTTATATATASSTTSDYGKAHPQGQELEVQQYQQQQQVKDELAVEVSSIERSRSNGGGRGFRTGRVSPAIEPPSPKVSACGFCSAFRKQDKIRRRAKPITRKM